MTIVSYNGTPYINKTVSPYWVEATAEEQGPLLLTWDDFNPNMDK